MAIDFSTINLIAVLVAALASFAIGFVWYGQLFGKQWMKLSGITPKDSKIMKKKAGPSMFIGFLTSLVTAFVLALIMDLLGYQTPTEGIMIAVWIWLGFAATLQLGSVLWENKPVNLFVLNTVQTLASFTAMGAIIGAF